MELSKLKHPQRFINNFEMYYRKFERKTQRHQRFIYFEIKMESLFLTLETSDIHITETSSPTIIDKLLI